MDGTRDKTDSIVTLQNVGAGGTRTYLYDVEDSRRGGAMVTNSTVYPTGRGTTATNSRHT